MLLHMQRNPEVMIAILAAWKLGAAYIPLDIEYPVERVRMIMEDSKASCLIADGTTSEIPSETAVWTIEELILESRKHSAENLGKNITGNHLSYIIYTSGTTGKPKGVMIEHKGMLNHLLVKVHDLKMDKNTVVDIGCWTPEGDLLFFGRMDDQVKIKGYRVELPEIDHALTRCPGVLDAATITVENRLSGACLVSFVISESKDVDAIRRFLGERLPPYMIPEQVIVLDRFPLNANGKVDRRKLLEIYHDYSDRTG